VREAVGRELGAEWQKEKAMTAQGVIPEPPKETTGVRRVKLMQRIPERET
jgi:hypothetical protein